MVVSVLEGVVLVAKNTSGAPDGLFFNAQWGVVLLAVGREEACCISLYHSRSRDNPRSNCSQPMRPLRVLLGRVL